MVVAAQLLMLFLSSTKPAILPGVKVPRPSYAQSSSEGGSGLQLRVTARDVDYADSVQSDFALCVGVLCVRRLRDTW